jgi:hypothetical protein
MSNYNNSTQESIVRQSSLKFVQEYANNLGSSLTLKETFSIANIVADYCQNGWSKDLGTKVDMLDKHIKDKYQDKA